jgi:hypothetical protein
MCACIIETLVFSDVDRGRCYLLANVSASFGREEVLLEYDGRNVRPAQHCPLTPLAQQVASMVSFEAAESCIAVDPAAVADALGSV